MQMLQCSSKWYCIQTYYFST